jgi:hypothetical protein
MMTSENWSAMDRTKAPASACISSATLHQLKCDLVARPLVAVAFYNSGRYFEQNAEV